MHLEASTVTLKQQDLIMMVLTLERLTKCPDEIRLIVEALKTDIW